jgi:pyridoxine 5-phosphate synthase
LGVNIDHVATIRQARRTVEPDPVWAAVLAELGGADCITFHLRKDRRHINDRDARLLRQTVRCKLNMEMSLEEEIVSIALEIKPDQATLVPEGRQEITTEGGLDVLAHARRLAEVTKALHAAGVIVSAFVDPHRNQIVAAREAGCDAIEIHTGRYANATGPSVTETVGDIQIAARDVIGIHTGRYATRGPVATTIEEIRQGLDVGLSAGLIVHGGHGLTYGNITPIAAMRGFTEFNIGHSIVSRAVFVGMTQAVAEMKRLIEKAAT